MRGSGVRTLAAVYSATVRITVLRQFQYRAANYLLIGSITLEATVYLLVWQAVAAEGGGSVAGWNAAQLAGYYLAWTLVRQVTVVLTPGEFERRIRHGGLTDLLVRPMHPVHGDLAEYAGWALVRLVLWAPVAGLLYLGFAPDVTTDLVHVLAFCAVVVAAFLVRALYFWLISLCTVWTVRGLALANIVTVLELLLSGRMVPMSMLPEWLQDVAAVLPFRWVFAFPVEVLIGRVERVGIWQGFLAQCVWVCVLAAGVALVWRAAVRWHSAVGT